MQSIDCCKLRGLIGPVAKITIFLQLAQPETGGGGNSAYQQNLLFVFELHFSILLLYIVTLRRTSNFIFSLAV